MSAPMSDGASHSSAQPAGSRFVLLCCVVLALVVDYADRNVLSLLLLPIGEDLSLSYLQLGSLSSALLIFYMIASLPISILVERVVDRSKLLATAVAVWTIFAALSGAAQGYRALLLCRIMVGIGEATVAPCAQTLISDEFPPSERTGAIGIYLSGISLGSVVGFGLGGLVTYLHAPWRWTMVVVAAPGMLVAAITWAFMADPRRGMAPRFIEGSTSASGDLCASIRALWSITGYGWLVMSSFFLSIAGGTPNFTAMFVQLKHGMTIEQSAIYNVVAMGLIPWASTIFGGQLIDVFVRRSGSIKWMLRFPQLFFPLAMACNVVGYLSTGRTLSLTAIAVSSVITAAMNPAWSSLVQTICPRGTRAVAITVLLLFTIGGWSISSLIVGALTDHFAPLLGEAGALSLALVLANAPSTIIGLLLSCRAACTIDFRSAVVIADEKGHASILL